jgi:hypothetical protein
MRRSLAAIVCAASLGLAQSAPDGAPLDLEALAAQLDPGQLPSVVAALPAAQVEWLRRRGGLLREADVDLALAWSEVEATRLAAVIAVLDGPVDANAVGVWREIRACSYFQRNDDQRAVELALAGLHGETPWWLAGADAARTRGRALAARFLREHADSPLLGEVLLFVASSLPVAERARVRRAALARLGAGADASHWILAASEALRELDLDGADALCARAATASPAPALAARRWTAARRLLLQERLALARPLAEAARGAGTEGAIARLQLLLTCGSAEVEATARALVAADVAHALPFAWLAAHEAVQGRHAVGAELLARAADRPGAGVTTAVATVLCRMMPLLARQPAAAERERLQHDLEALLQDVDAAAVADASPSAQVLRWLCAHDLLPPHADLFAALQQALPAARRLAAALPTSIAAHWVLWTTAAFAADPAVATEVLVAPLPAALAGQHDLVRVRAELFVRDLVAGRGGSAAQLGVVLADLERVQQDARDAAYLRGIVAWHEAVQRRGDRERMQAARDHFAAAQRSVAERGWWRAAAALAVADLGLGAAVDLQPLLDRAGLRDGGDPHLGPTLLAMLLLAADVDASTLATAQTMLARIERPAASAPLLAAAAVGAARRGEPGDAARHAGQAVAAIERLEPWDLRPDRGVASQGRLDWGFVLDRWGLQLRWACAYDLWALPPLPDRDGLRQLVAAPR